MKKLLLLVTCIFAFSSAQAFTEKSEDTPLSLGITHLLPSAYVIPSGVIVLGTTVGAGLFDMMDISTNLYLDVIQIFNASVKFNLYKSDIIALSIWASYLSQTIKVTTTQGTLINVPTSQVSSAFTPGLTFSYRIRRHLTGHAGVSVPFWSNPVGKSVQIPRSGLVQGTTLYKEFTYGFNPTVALAIGGTYDVTYDTWGFGPTLHVGGFQAGVHYYLNVQENAVLPIIGGGYSTQLD